MKKRKILTIILAGFIIIPVFIALYKVNTSFNLPFTIPNQNSFQLSSAILFPQNMTISPVDPGLNKTDSRIAVDSKNNIHLVYVNSSNGNDVVYSNSTNFTVVKQISNNPNSDETPAIAIDNNNIYIVWVASNGTQKDIVITNSSDWFSTNLTISKNDSWDDTNPDIAIDDSGVVHVVWEAPHNMTGLPDIWYTNSSNNYQNITIISNNPQYGDLTPSIAVGPDNLVYIVWSGVGSSTDEIWHVNSTDNFASNRTISNNPPSANFDRNPDIFVSNSILITWEAGISGVPNIYLVDSSNNWKNRTISSGANYNLYPRIVEGPGNLAHMIWILNITYNYSVLYSNNLGNYTTNTTIAMNSSSPFPGDIGVDSTGRVHIIWICNNQTYYNSSTYPDYPAVRLLKSNLLPMELNKPGTAMLAYGEFYDEFYIEKVEIMWSTNTGVSWNNFLMFGSGNGTKWKGTGFIPGYQYGVVLLYKFKIVDKVGQEHETAQQMFYYPDTRTESIVLIIILFGVLGTLTALYLIPQTRRFFGKLFSRKKPETAEKPKKPEVEKTPES